MDTSGSQCRRATAATLHAAAPGIDAVWVAATRDRDDNASAAADTAEGVRVEHSHGGVVEDELLCRLLLHDSSSVGLRTAAAVQLAAARDLFAVLPDARAGGAAAMDVLQG